MNTTIRILAATLGTALAAGAASAADVRDDTRAEVVYVEPETFTDVKDNYFANEETRDYLLGRLREHIVDLAQDYVPEGQRLLVTVTDVDMAGDFEPWHGPRMSDIRIVRDRYPPRIKLSFQVVDVTGRVLKEGKRDLRDFGFMMSRPLDSDLLRYEKAMLEDWLRREFPRGGRS